MFSSILLPILAATAARAADHLIVVGGPGLLAYTPSNITAAPGDTITFEFHEKNHTATQAAFTAPCVPLAGGFNSGFNPVAAGTTSGFPTFTITVNDTKPIWAYCMQPGPPAHCPSGMVFSANAPATGNTFDAFQQAAEALGNGTTTTTSSAAAYTSPPPPVVETVTATVTVDDSIYTTTYASWSGAPADPTPASDPVVHIVNVGPNGTLTFDPPTIVAELGDIVQFQFNPKNHSVTQSPFNNPCTNLATATNGSMIGFDSGFMPVAAGAAVAPVFNVTVNVTTPIWGYCRQTGHCFQGMVFGINPPTSGPNTFDAFQMLALHANSTSTASSPGSSNTTTTTPGQNGAGHAAVSTSLGLGIVGLVVAALL
ncbi:hypothetical protein K439DRAFT_1653549 [Ramaria rubella]|nr:hypothetical protein K439DRAFT_1653549 [Ramaria rubella]